MGFLATIGDAIADRLLPIVEAKGQQLLDKAEAKASELLDQIADTIKAEIAQRIPQIIEAVVLAVTKTMGELAVNGVDRVTDMVPGQLDDQIVDPLARNILDEVKNRLGVQF